jgi:hypothetical protein
METIKDREELLQLLPKGMVIAELGVFMGTYSKVILELAQPKELYLIDIWQEGRKGHSMGELTDNMGDLYRMLIDKYNDSPNIHVLRITTKEFLTSIPDNALDMVYIDADHAYEAVVQDLFMSYPKVRKYITGHDYDKPTVKQAVDEFCQYFDLEIELLTDINNGSQSFLIKKK